MSKNDFVQGRHLRRRSLVLACVASLAPATVAGAGDAAFVQEADAAGVAWGPCPEFMPEGCQLAVVQGNPAEANSDVFFKLPGNSSAVRHWHHSAERMVLISGELQVTYDGQEPMVIHAGSYAYGPPTVPHSAECRSDEACVLFIAFEQPLDAMAGQPD